MMNDYQFMLAHIPFLSSHWRFDLDVIHISSLDRSSARDIVLHFLSFLLIFLVLVPLALIKVLCGAGYVQHNHGMRELPHAAATAGVPSGESTWYLVQVCQ